MKKGDYCEAVVETIEFPNKGVLHIDGERVIVKNALPGQTIRFVINKKEKREMRRTPFRGSGTFFSGADRRDMSSFWHLRRMSLSESAL